MNIEMITYVTGKRAHKFVWICYKEFEAWEVDRFKGKAWEFTNWHFTFQELIVLITS